MRLQKFRVIDMWRVTDAPLTATSNLHYWFDSTTGTTLVSDSANIPAAAWKTVNTEDADYMAIQFVCNTISVTGSPTGPTTANFYPNAMGSVMKGGEIAGFPSAMPGTTITATMDSSLRRGTNLSIWNNDWVIAGAQNQPTAKILSGQSFWPLSTVPAAGVSAAVWCWVGHRSANMITPATNSAIGLAEMPNIKGLSEVAVACKTVTTYTAPTTVNITAALQIILYKDVATLDPLQFYLPGHKSQVNYV